MSLSLNNIDNADLAELSNACQVSVDSITDVYHCTPLQVATMVGSLHHSDAYYFQGICALDPSVDPERYVAAFEQVIEANSVLRTRIVDSTSHGLVQVVLQREVPIERSFSDMEAYMQHVRSQQMGLGTPLMRWALVDRQLVLTFHHAIFDLTALRALMDDVSKTYCGQMVSPRAPFRQFVERCSSIDDEAAKAFWRPRFDSMASIFPRVDGEYTARATSHIAHQYPLFPGSRTPVSQLPAYIEAAWALVSAIYTGEQTVAYGLTFSGRTPQLGSIGSTLGPTVVVVPVQVSLDYNLSISRIVKNRAKERREALSSPALQYGATRIQAVSQEANQASRFQSTVSISTAAESKSGSSETRMISEREGSPICAILMRFSLQKEAILIDVDFDPQVICEQQMWRVLHQFEHVLRQLIHGPHERKLKELALISAQDLAEVYDWNSTLPPPRERCLHDLFHERALLHPDKQAVESGDRNATYGELDALSSQLAHELVENGVRPGDAVTIHVDRSCWAIVSIFATMKAGACCVPIAVTNPRARKEAIVEAARSGVVITSDTHEDISGLAPKVIVGNSDYWTYLSSNVGHPTLPSVSPDQLAYIIFTSGSTGTPKGVMLEHRSLATSFTANREQQRWEPEDRILQFATLAWDASLMEIFGALLFGGCLCIPSNGDRESNLTGYINAKRVNSAILTPTVLRTLVPSEVPTLENITSAGEVLDPDAASLWAARAHFINGWGVSEASISNASHVLSPDSLSTETIGRPMGCAI